MNRTDYLLPLVAPATHVGKLTADRVVLIGVVPDEGQGVRVRAVHYLVDATVNPSKTDYWTLFLGTYTGQDFSGKVEISLSDGCRAAPARFSVSGGLRLPPGSVVALKAVQRGSPAPLDGLSVALEVGSTGIR